MPSRINGIDSKPVRVAAASPVQRRTQEADAAPESAPDPVSDVRLSGRAQELAGIEQSLRDLPAVDEKRVAEVKKRLDDGSYHIDAQRIADKLLYLEDEFQRGNPQGQNSLT